MGIYRGNSAGGGCTALAQQAAVRSSKELTQRFSRSREAQPHAHLIQKRTNTAAVSSNNDADAQYYMPTTAIHRNLEIYRVCTHWMAKPTPEGAAFFSKAPGRTERGFFQS